MTAKEAEKVAAKSRSKNAGTRRRNPSLQVLITSTVLVFTLVGVTALCLFCYLKLKTRTLADIDRRLLLATETARRVLPKDFHDRIAGPASVSVEDYTALVREYDRLCLEHDLEYLWSVMEVDGVIRFTSGTSTDKEHHRGGATFFQEHSNPEAYRQAFATMKKDYRTIEDRWGRLRAVLVPRRDARGRKHLFGACMRTDEVNRALRANLVQSGMLGLFTLLLFGGLGLLLSRRLLKPVKELTKKTRLISGGHYGETVQPSRIRELGDLAENFNRMSHRVAETLSALQISREDLRTTLDSIGDGVIATDRSAQVIRMNKVAEELTGWPAGEARGRPIGEVFRIVDLRRGDPCENPVDRVLAQDRIVGMETPNLLIARDGRRRQIADSGAPIRTAAGEVTGVVLVFRDVTDDYGLRERLRESEEMYRRLYETSVAGLFRARLEDGVILRANQAAAELLDCSGPEELVGREEPPVSLQGSAGLANFLAELRRKGEVGNHELTLPTPEGGERHLLVSAKADPKQGWFEGVLKDISKLRRAEDELRTARETLETSLAQSPSGIIIADAPGGRIRLANSAAFDIRGGDPRMLTDIEIRDHSAKWQTFLPDGEPYPTEKLPLSRAILEGVVTRDEEVIIRDKKGRDHWVSANAAPVRDSRGEVVAGIVVFHDITRRKEHARRLEASEENLRITLDSIGDGVITTDTSGRVYRMNPVAEKLTGWKADEARGRAIEEVFTIVNARTNEPTGNPVEKVLTTDRIVGLANHTVLIARDGTRRQIADSGAPIRNAEGDVTGVVLVFRDVTEEYALQEQLQQSRKLDAIGRLAGGVAHDFNNMLGGILGAAELLETTLDQHSKERQYLEIIKRASGNAADLTEKLLTFARKGRTRTAILDIHEAIRDALALLERTVDRRVRIKTDLQAAPSTVSGDLSQLQNAILNLGINAADAMTEGGDLAIATRNLVLDEIYCNNSPFDLTPGEHVDIEVRDTGSGIPPEKVQRIFEPFFTTKPHGRNTGLGLAAVYGTIQQHHGAITVYSEVDRGTVFHLTLPLARVAGEGPGAPTAEPPSRGRGRILVVDDEEFIRTTTREMLKDLGYRVVLAADGREAVDIFAREKEKIDLVVLDLVMPEMNGRQAFLAMQEIDPEVRVIITSGFSHDINLEELENRGFRGFLRKPYRQAELSRMVAAALAR